MGRVSCQRQGPSVRTIIVRRSTLKTRRRFWMRFCYAEAIEEPLRVFVWRSRNVSAGSDAPLPAPILPGHLLWARPVQPFQASGPPGEESMPYSTVLGFWEWLWEHVLEWHLPAPTLPSTACRDSTNLLFHGSSSRLPLRRISCFVLRVRSHTIPARHAGATFEVRRPVTLP
jgi:hypothetical protein